MPSLDEHLSDHDDEPVDRRAHKRLLDAVGRLHKTQFIKKPTRSEPAIRRSEFHLVKTHLVDESAEDQTATRRSRKAATVSVPDLVKVLNRTSKHLSIGKELRTNDKTKKVLERPLERPVADRIARSVGYEKAKNKLSRWNALVTRNRATDHMSFPLKQDGKALEIVNGSSANYSHFRIKSELSSALEALDPPPADEPEVYVQGDGGPDDENAELKLSRAEMIARSKELRLLRIRESHKSAKARMQNKIKSKKFHKIMKKEKLKEQMKEFEALQRDDPEAAMRKLDQIEKQRAEERALLRHKNTGTWAKNLQVRAKYDKDVRKELSQQLAIGRELTQQRQPEEEEDEDGGGEEAAGTALDAFNPWLKSDGAAEAAQEAAESVGGYRKYWNERNENEEALRKWREEVGRPTPIKLKPKVIKSKVGAGWLVQECSAQEAEPQVGVKETKKAARKAAKPHSDNIDDLFDDAEETLRTKVSSKLDKLKHNLSEADSIHQSSSRRPKGKRAAAGSNSGDLSFKQTAKRANIDEALDHGDDSDSPEAQRKAIEDLRNVSSLPSSTKSAATTSATAATDINPNTFIQVKPKHLRTALPEMEGAFDESDDEAGRHDAKRLTIAEAFEDDDILADFERDQDAEKRRGEPEEINLTLPGWGSWAGTGIEKRPHHKKLILKFPKKEERRPENRGHVIIVDNDNRKLRDHQVSKLPFPFTSVAEYEASIRAPIGRDFVPATAHQLLTKPAVTTQLGAIIEPMKEEMLLRRPTAPRTKTTKKIAELNKAAAARKEKKKK